VARSVDEAVALLGDLGEDAKLLAGGHSLIPLMRLRLARPSVLVDIDRLSDLAYVREDDGHVEIGATTRMHDVANDPVLKTHCPLLPFAARLVGDPQVRHRATFGGSVAHGDPASDPPAVLLALDAEMVVRGPEGTRTIRAEAFFRDLFETDLGPQDVLTAVRVPKLPPGTGWSYQKFRRRSLDWAIVGVAAVLSRSAGRVDRAALALTNMGMTPLRARGVESALTGAEATTSSFAAAADLAPEGTSPTSDTNATAEYRQEVSKVLVRRALEEATSR
jgi:carbon-monoxide dehydrogenase medium subunit